jgi:hypothetical protein
MQMYHSVTYHINTIRKQEKPAKDHPVRIYSLSKANAGHQRTLRATAQAQKFNVFSIIGPKSLKPRKANHRMTLRTFALFWAVKRGSKHG